VSLLLICVFVKTPPPEEELREMLEYRRLVAEQANASQALWIHVPSTQIIRIPLITYNAPLL
jgi:hypothetical protein